VTGSEMIVWADMNGSFFNTGGYTIRAIDIGQLPAPPARPLPREFNTGRKWGPVAENVIVWGRKTAAFEHRRADTGAENRRMHGRHVDRDHSTIGAPPLPGAIYTAGWTGSEMIVLGRRPAAGSFIYTPAGDTIPGTASDSDQHHQPRPRWPKTSHGQCGPAADE